MIFIVKIEGDIKCCAACGDEKDPDTYKTQIGKSISIELCRSCIQELAGEIGIY